MSDDAYWAGVLDAFMSKRGCNFKRICLVSDTPDWAVNGLTKWVKGSSKRLTGSPMNRRVEISNFSVEYATRVFQHSRFFDLSLSE